jgi:ISXO2-like transposase domain
MRVVGVEPMGGPGETVELDETALGWPEGYPLESKRQGGWQNKNVVFTLVQRGGSARSFHIEGTTVGHMMPIIRANIAAETAVMTDAASWYKYMNLDGYFGSHDRVEHREKTCAMACG